MVTSVTRRRSQGRWEEASSQDQIGIIRGIESGRGEWKRKIRKKENKTKGRKIRAWEKRMKEKENKIKVVQFVYGVPTVRVGSPRIKVALRKESYAWVPESWDFAKVRVITKTEKKRRSGESLS